MKTIPSTTAQSSRCWVVAEIPQPHPDDLAELEIYLSYTTPGDAAKGIAIDSYLVPLCKLAPKLLEIVHAHVADGPVTLGLTPEEIQEVKRLSGDHSIPRQ